MKGKVPLWMIFGIGLLLVTIASFFSTIVVFFALVFFALLMVGATRFDIFKKRPGRAIASFRIPFLGTLDVGAVDLALIILELAIFAFIMFFIGGNAIAQVPWWLIILVAVIAEAISWATGKIPFIGDSIGAFIIFGVVFFSIGGVAGLVLGTVGAMIAMVPLLQEIPIWIVLSFIIIRAFSGVVGGLIGGIV